MRLPPLPKKVKGAIIDYVVTLGTVDPSLAGECALNTKGAALRISDAYPPEYQWQTFIHEWLHKIEREAGVSLKDDEGDSDVDRLATAIVADFLRNKWTLPGG